MRNILFLDDENENLRALLIPTETTIEQIQKFIIKLENLIYKHKIIKEPLLDISSDQGYGYMDFRIGLRGDAELDEDEFSVKPILSFGWDGMHICTSYFVLWESNNLSNRPDTDRDIIKQIVLCIKEICRDNLIDALDWAEISECIEKIEDIWCDIDWSDDAKNEQFEDPETVDLYDTSQIKGILYFPDDTIDDLSLNVRSYNVLKRAGNKTVADLIHVSNEELEKYRGINQKSFEEITEIRDKIISCWKIGGFFDEYYK